MIEWQWDPEKDLLNRRRHGGLGLAAGVIVMSDPLAASRPDPATEERRWQTVGGQRGRHRSFVRRAYGAGCAARRPAGGRIIGVRKATPHERKAYEDGAF
jgi:uncharacterized DUF497 family protein